MSDLSDDELLAIRQAFQLYDKDGQDKISIQQVGAVLYSLGHHPAESQLNDWINKVRQPYADHITYNQFCELVKMQKAHKQIEDDYRDAFLMFDKNNDGFIEARELRTIFNFLGEKVTDEEIDDIIRTGDFDNDGMINYEEFVYLLENNS